MQLHEAGDQEHHEGVLCIIILNLSCSMARFPGMHPQEWCTVERVQAALCQQGAAVAAVAAAAAAAAHKQAIALMQV